MPDRTMIMKRIFIAFASEDQKYRDFLKGQSLHTSSPFEYVDMSVKEPYSSSWKEHVRTRIKGSDGVISLLSINSLSAEGQKWEMLCAHQENIPMMGIYISKDDRSTPREMAGYPKYEWTWENIAWFINSI